MDSNIVKTPSEEFSSHIGTSRGNLTLEDECEAALIERETIRKATEHGDSDTEDEAEAGKEGIDENNESQGEVAYEAIEGVKAADFTVLNRSKDTSQTYMELPYDLKEVLHKSILFYEAQRSGPLPSNNRISWRGDSCLTDQGENGEDLTGGWFDAGDYIKFGLPMAWSTTVLAWGLIEYRDVYELTGELQNMLGCIKWTADYFIKCHTNPNEFYYQVGDPKLDHKRWGRAEDMDLPRPSFKIDEETPGSDVAGETAAALAACAIAFNDTDKDYALLLLEHAIQLYKFASTHRGKYPSHEYYRPKRPYENKLTWAAVWLYYATSSPKYLNDAIRLYSDHKMSSRAYSFGYGDSCPGVQLLLFLFTGDEKYAMNFKKYMDEWMPGGKIPYTPKGLVHRNAWGALRYAATNAFLATLAADYGLKPDMYRKFATTQIGYILGDTGRSFVCGFGVNPPVRPHHRGSSCPAPPAVISWKDLRRDEANPNILYGALVGGPDISDNYTDDRRNYVANEVATDYNAGFQSAVAGLKHYQISHMKKPSKFHCIVL
ncbi:endoglucanase F-like [Ptychodera flava]|uniref:endoglucanase F-like n=1 Tax=Ptychodera flava TaxID=63121 RepID=UPI00396A7FA2